MVDMEVLVWNGQSGTKQREGTHCAGDDDVGLNSPCFTITVDQNQRQAREGKRESTRVGRVRA